MLPCPFFSRPLKLVHTAPTKQFLNLILDQCVEPVGGQCYFRINHIFFLFCINVNSVFNF